MARIMIELSEKDTEFLTQEARANGFGTAAEWVDELFRQHLAREFFAKRWRFEDRPKGDSIPHFVTDPGGGVWHEDDYPGE